MAEGGTDIRVHLRSILENEGYHVDTVTGAAEALAALTDKTYDLLISNVDLPDRSGLALCRAARGIAPSTAQILLGDEQSLENAVQAVEEDISAYIILPLRKYRILIKVRRALDRIFLQREREDARLESHRAKEHLERKNKELESTLTQLLRARTLLAESDKLVSVGLLAAGVAHEINNPACFILPNLEYLDRSSLALANLATQSGAEPLAVEREREHFLRMLDRCAQGLRRILRVVDTLQLFSQRDHEDVRPLDLNTHCEAIIDLVRHVLAHKAPIEFAASSDLPNVYARPQDVAQTLLNLLISAHQAITEAKTTQDHHIRVSLQAQSQSVILMVVDTGRRIEWDNGTLDFQFLITPRRISP